MYFKRIVSLITHTGIPVRSWGNKQNVGMAFTGTDVEQKREIATCDTAHDNLIFWLTL